MLKNWKVPTVFLVLLVIAMIFRWDNIGSSTKDGTITKTAMDRWNGAVWQTTIKNGGYTEKIIKPSWIERSRKQIEKQIEYQEAVYSSPPSLGRLFEQQNEGKTLDEIFQRPTYVTKTKTIQIPPTPIYWLSRNGLTKLWGYITAIMAVWFLIAIIRSKRENRPEVPKSTENL